MEITQLKVKQYNSTYKHIVIVNGKPVCITDSYNRAGIIIAYLYGYDVKINDGKIKKMLDKIIKEQRGDCNVK